MSNKIVTFLLVLCALSAPALACVNNSLFAYTATIDTNGTNTSTQYDCFDFSTAISLGYINSTWYNGLISDAQNSNQTNKGYCYNNLNSTMLCTTNNTYVGNWVYPMQTVTGTGTTFAVCTFPSNGSACGMGYYRNINVTNSVSAIPYVVNGTYFDIGSADNQVVWGTWVTNGQQLYYSTGTDDYQIKQADCTNLTQEVEYGNGTSGALNPFDSNFVGVYHFKEGTGTNVEESKKIAGYSNGTWQNLEAGTSWTNGKFGYGVHPRGQTGGTSHYITIPNSTSTEVFSGTSQFTVEAWVKRVDDWNWKYILGKYNQVSDLPEFGMLGALDGGNYMAFCQMFTPPALYCRTDHVGLTFSVSTTNYDYLVCERNATHLNFYYNGVPVSSKTCAESIVSSVRPLAVAYFDHAATPYAMNVTVDELRLSKVARGPAWINATYQATLGTLGAQAGSGPLAFSNYTVYPPTYSQQYGLFTANVYNEDDRSLWNMSLISNVSLIFTCTGSQSVQNVTSNSGNKYILYDTPLLLTFAVNQTAVSGGNYYRRQVPQSCSSLSNCTETIGFYLVDLTQKTLVQVIWTLADWTGNFGGGQLQLSHPIGSLGTYLITSDWFGADGLATTYLMQGMRYTITVIKNGISQSIGFIDQQTSTSQTVTIANTEFNATTTRIGVDVNTGTQLSDPFITMFYNDTSGSVVPVTFIVTETNGTVVYNTTSTCYICTASYNYTVTGQNSFFVTVLANSWNWTWNLNVFNASSFIGDGTLSRGTFKWASVLMLVGFASLVGALSLPAGSVLFGFMVILFSWMGWLQLPAFTLVLAVLMSFAIAILSRRMQD